MAAGEAAIAGGGDPLQYRFDMQQGGRAMDADDFDAWMAARGIRIATGTPAPVPRGKARARK